MSDWRPHTVTADYYVAEQYLGDTEDEVIGQIKERMTRMLAEGLAEHLHEAKGGAIYSPITYTIRTATDIDGSSLGRYRVVGTVQVQDFPNPESGEFRLIDGPMHGAIVKGGMYPPTIMPVPRVLSFELPSRPDKPTFIEYERVPGVQAYRWHR